MDWEIISGLFYMIGNGFKSDRVLRLVADSLVKTNQGCHAIKKASNATGFGCVETGANLVLDSCELFHIERLMKGERKVFRVKTSL